VIIYALSSFSTYSFRTFHPAFNLGLRLFNYVPLYGNGESREGNYLLYILDIVRIPFHAVYIIYDIIASLR